MKKNALGLYFLSLSLFALFSCNTGSRKADRMLQAAENVVEQLPDSALRLLDSIPKHYELNERQQAKYTLLYVQAKDKSYRDITFDTEIFSVKDYYIRKKDFPNAALAAFYCGLVGYEQKNVEKAVYAYFEAKEIAEKTVNYNLRGLIQGNLSVLYRQHSLYKEAIASNKAAVEMYDRAKNYRNKISAMQLIGDCYLLSEKTDTAFYYYSESLRLADSCNLPKLQSSIKQNMGVAFKQKGNYNEAIKFLGEAIALSVDSVERARILLNIAQVYILEDKTDSVKIYLDKALKLNNNDPWLMRTSYLLRTKVKEKEKNYPEALKFYKEYYNATFKVFDNEENSKVLELQKKYDFAKVKNSNAQLTIKHQRLQILLLLSLLATGLVILLFYWKSARNKRLMTDLEEKTVELQKMADNVSKENQTFRGIAFSQFDIITKAALIKNELCNEELEKETTQKLLKKFNKIVYGQDTPDWDTLYQLMNILQKDLYKKIKEKYPKLTETEFRVLCLSCENTNDTEIAIILNQPISMIRKLRNQVRMKLNMPRYTHDYISFFK